uniref:Uncharacterized protein n=1 Tax=Meloidogyne enterolobii TaxID=390850 RepID=A0A6V7XIN8_MELEN|nr:unnamed protein product [Meloidogyne enterolobii]
MSLSLLKIFFSVSKIQNRRACSLLFNSKNLLFNRNISLKNVRNIKTKKEFDDNLFEELYGFKFKKQLNREEIKQKILEIIKRQPSINQELIKEKGLNAWFTSLELIIQKGSYLMKFVMNLMFNYLLVNMIIYKLV